MAVGGREKETASGWGNKSLYICTTESKLDFRTRYAIHSIRLSDLLSLDEKRDDTSKGDHSDASKSKFKSKSKYKYNSCGGLQKVAAIYNEHVPRGMSCGVFGSQIIFAGGTNFRPSGQEISKKIYVFETDPTVDPNPSLKEFEPGFLESKGEPFLVELEGNLYALSGIYEGSPTFEVFSKRSRFWFPKRDPPFFEGYFCCGGCHTYLSIAVAGTKILVSCPKNPKVFCFDVAKHRYLGEWTILSGSDCGLPFVGKTLVLDLDDSSDDKVLFTYQFIHSNVRKDNSEDWGIVPYRMSINDSESSISINPIKTEHLRRAVVPSEFWGVATTHSFVHLGGRKVCCVIARHIKQGEDEGEDWMSNNQEDGNKIRLAFLTFKFQVSATTKSDDGDGFSAKILNTRIFEYDCSKESDAATYHATLAGCFLR